MQWGTGVHKWVSLLGTQQWAGAEIRNSLTVTQLVLYARIWYDNDHTKFQEYLDDGVNPWVFLGYGEKRNKSIKIIDVDIRKKMSQWLSRRKPWSRSAIPTLTTILNSFALLLFTLIWQTLSLNEFSPLSRIPKEKPYFGKVMINPWLCTLSMTSIQSWFY